MTRCIANASMATHHIDYICAHGPSDTDMDVEEARCIRGVFGTQADTVSVSSIKGSTGCPMGTAGALQTIAAAKALSCGAIPPTANLQFIDKACELNHVMKRPRRSRPKTALINSHGFGRGNTCVILKHYHRS